MGRTISDATALRKIKSELAGLIKDCAVMRGERDTFRVRAIKAEQEVVEWKERFDILLKRDGVSAS